MSKELEKMRLQLLEEIASKVYTESFDTADKMCDYYRLLFGKLPGEL